MQPVLLVALLAVFLPVYSALVGACILLAPSHINTVAFSHGFYFKQPPQGIARFSHWTYCAHPHVGTFILMLSFLVWNRLFPGLFVTAVIAVRVFVVWSDFKLDKTISLGADDCQSVFLALTRSPGSLEGFCVEVRGVVREIPRGSG
jgi:hypothetical protein